MIEMHLGGEKNYTLFQLDQEYVAIIFFNRTIEYTQAAKALSDFDLL